MKTKNNRHVIQFTVNSNDSLLNAVTEVQVLIRAHNGWHTRAIAADLRLSVGQVEYRIRKGASVGCRKKFRDGLTVIAQKALQATAADIIAMARKDLMPKFK